MTGDGFTICTWPDLALDAFTRDTHWFALRCDAEGCAWSALWALDGHALDTDPDAAQAIAVRLMDAHREAAHHGPDQPLLIAREHDADAHA